MPNIHSSIVQVQEILTILQYCVHLCYDISIVLHSQMDSLAFIVFLFFFCRDKYNWAEEIDVAGDIVVGQWENNYQRNWYVNSM